MKPPPFLVVADRGHMKAYLFKSATGHGPAPVLAEKLDLAETFLKYDERFTDQAGAFPSGAASGMATAVAERTSLEEEKKVRICKHLREQLTEWLSHYDPPSWWFAASPEINGAILHGMTEVYRKKLVRNVKQDLVKVPQSELLERLNHPISKNNSLLRVA